MALDKIPGTFIQAEANVSNVISVSVDNGPTINANGINFLNTSAVSITVQQGANGKANVSIATPVTLGLLLVLSGD